MIYFNFWHIDRNWRETVSPLYRPGILTGISFIKVKEMKGKVNLSGTPSVKTDEMLLNISTGVLPTDSTCLQFSICSIIFFYSLGARHPKVFRVRVKWIRSARSSGLDPLGRPRWNWNSEQNIKTDKIPLSISPGLLIYLFLYCQRWAKRWGEKQG